MRQETIQRLVWLAVRMSPACVKVWYTEHTLKRSYLHTSTQTPVQIQHRLRIDRNFLLLAHRRGAA